MHPKQGRGLAQCIALGRGLRSCSPEKCRFLQSSRLALLVSLLQPWPAARPSSPRSPANSVPPLFPRACLQTRFLGSSPERNRGLFLLPEKPNSFGERARPGSKPDLIPRSMFNLLVVD